MASLVRMLICGIRSFETDGKGGEIEHGPAPHFRRTDIMSVYDVGPQLGQSGTFGEARAAVHRTTGQCVAIKTVKKHKRLTKMLRLEEHVLRNLDHDNIARLFAVYESRKDVCFVLEKCERGDLIDMIVANGGRLNEKLATKVFRQLAHALNHIHKKGFAHCDLKPSNILFGCDSKVKLIDFGVAQRVRAGHALHLEVGSPSFMAPEVISGCYTEFCDMWSLGVCMFVTLFGFNPWNPRAEQCAAVHRRICARVLRGFDPSTREGFGAFFPESIPVSDDAKDLISTLLRANPADRLSAEAVVSHPWLSSLDVETEA